MHFGIKLCPKQIFKSKKEAEFFTTCISKSEPPEGGTEIAIHLLGFSQSKYFFFSKLKPLLRIINTNTHLYM